MNIEIVPNNQTNNCTQLTPTFGSRPGAIADDEAVFPSWKMETYLGLHFLSSMMEIGDPTGSSIADELPNIGHSQVSDGYGSLQHKQQIEKLTKDLFLTFRCYCTRKDACFGLLSC
ncbi:hypothetical protein LWI28_028913 [Acer negundo]|uniref:Uncharacterized protein n=1 Tax=Acer negundo TaxID=4023 RepID=A0AAD5J8X0_ACENE|nr:hypothetical protein LWI28_028913 [Acer negundo]